MVEVIKSKKLRSSAKLVERDHVPSIPGRDSRSAARLLAYILYKLLALYSQQLWVRQTPRFSQPAAQ